MKEKAVILLSGGIDSLTCLAMALQQDFDCYCISFDYGQRHRSELKAAKNIAKHFQVAEHKIITLDLNQIGGSVLTDKSKAVPQYSNEQIIKTTYVPARNTIFLSIALGYAETRHANRIFFGANALDNVGFPDARPDYIRAFEAMAQLATKTGVEGQTIKIETPLIQASKADIIKKGQQLGVDYAMAITCYQADSEGLACGDCDSCQIRAKGFQEAGIKDPTNYIPVTL